MENGFPSRDASKMYWWLYLLVLLAAVGALVTLHLSGISAQTTRRVTGSASPAGSIATGDFYVKIVLSELFHRDTKRYTREAISSYRDALPWPAAYRRIIVTKQSLMKESASAEMKALASLKSNESLSEERVDKLKSEVVMWREVYGHGTLSPTRARQYVSHIKRLNLGPLKQVAISDVYTKSGQKAKAASVLRSARSSARASAVAFGIVVIALVIAGVIGFVLIIYFLMTYGNELVRASRPKIRPDVLLRAFVAYLIGYFVLGLVMELVALAFGVDTSTTTGLVELLLLQIVAMLGAYAITLATLFAGTEKTHEDPREVNRRTRLAREIQWGVGGYCAALPLLSIAVMISAALSNTVFKRIPTPEHPIESTVLQGGPVFAVAFIMAVIFAPLVEETAFRGMLYNGLRGRMGVWSAAVLSGAIFAIVHPTLPGGFLPILALGVVLAILREKTGSLMPSMVCHGLNNAIMFLLLWLQT